MSNETHDLILIKHKIKAIRDQVNQSLDALSAEIESRLPDDENIKRNGPGQGEDLRAYVMERRKANAGKI